MAGLNRRNYFISENRKNIKIIRQTNNLLARSG